MHELSTELLEILGSKGWLVGDGVASYRRDWLDRYGARPLGIARPASTEEVAAVVAACRRAKVCVVPQGGNTGLCGGAVCGQDGGVILSLARMNRIGTPEPDTGAIEVEAGVVLAALHKALATHNLMFPLHLGAEGTAQIGGLIGTNAGGSHALRFGMMQDLIFGLEVVLADGAVWDGMRSVQKDNAGYQLRRLFCGAEGTLGIVTRAVLRLFPAPKVQKTALLAMSTVDALVSFATRLRADAGENLNGLEFFCDLGLALALKNIDGLKMPLDARAPWYLLVELSASSLRVPLTEILEDALTSGLEVGEVLDGVIATSESQRAALWRLREEQPEGQRLAGAQLKNDVSVPPGRLGEFLVAGQRICEGILPGVRINPFGHLGDGNTHYNLSPPLGAAGFGTHAARLTEELGALAGQLGGSFAAEHGLGRSKIALADALRSRVERNIMTRIKMALDPENLLNPGVVLRLDQHKNYLSKTGFS